VSAATTFLLIRHGMCDPVGKVISGRLPGVHLNEEGRAQAARLAEGLVGGWAASGRIAAIHSSPLERARETAAPLAARIDVAVQESPALNEIDFGEWSGRSLDELEGDVRWQAWNAFRGGRRAPGGEIMLEVQARALAELERLRLLHPGQVVALFSHCDVIRAAILHYLGAPAEMILRLEVAPASVSRLRIDEWGARLLSLNELV
jgi:probable phosphoglycerate mutase